MRILDNTAANGLPFRVVWLEKGECGPFPAAISEDYDLVEIYDRRYPETEHGQFCGSRYRRETLIGAPERGLLPRTGLNVHGGVPDWTIDRVTWAIVHAWLTHPYNV